MLSIFLVKMHGLFLWKTRKGIASTNAFQKMLDGSRHEDNIPGSNRNNRRVDKGRDFYNRPTEL